jgi:hypothetical protein
MNLLDLPLELFQRILHFAIIARGWESGMSARALRLRLVNRLCFSIQAAE